MQDRVHELCQKEILRHQRIGSLWAIDPDSIEKVREARRDWRQRLIPLEEAVEATGWPRWVLLDLIDAGLLVVHNATAKELLDRRAKLIDREQLADVVATAASAPGVCGVCGEGVPYARRFHKGRCAGTAAAAWLHRTADGGKTKRLTRKKRVERYKSLKAATGVVDIHDLARDLDRSYRSIWKHAENLGRGERAVPGPNGGTRPLLFTEADVARIRRAVEEHPWSHVYRDPKRRGDWYYRRFKSRAQYGRAAKALATAKGTTVGRPREKLTDEKIARIRKLRMQGYSQRRIAYIEGISRGLVEHVLRQQEVA